MAKLLLKLSLVDTRSLVSVEGKALNNQVVAGIGHFSQNKEYTGFGWLFLDALQDLGKRR